MKALIKIAVLLLVTVGWLSRARAEFLIDASHRNGSFELAGGSINTSKIQVWDGSPDIDDWTKWAEKSTANDDSGVEASTASTDGTMIGYMQPGNAVCNLSGYTAKAGDVFKYSFDYAQRTSSHPIGISFDLVYDNGGTITGVNDLTVITIAGSNLPTATYSGTYTVQAGDPLIGKPVGVGFFDATNYPNFDHVVLAVNEDHSSPRPAGLAGSLSNGAFTISISNLVPNATCTLVGADDLTGRAWRLVKAITPSSSTAIWTTNINPVSSQEFYAIGRPQAEDAIRSGVGWFDNHGNPVSAHGACIVKDNGLFYLFGEFKNDTNNVFSGVSCYTSPDLYNWTFDKIVLPVQPSGRLGPNRVGERPKVMKCPATGKYVMYMHTDSTNYNDQAVGYATSDTIDGVYTFQGPLLENGSMIRKWDMGAFQDDNGIGYIITHSGCLYKLGPDYTNVVETTVNDAFGACEAPAMFKKDGTYFWLGSGLSGWERNDNYYYTATNIAGPWIYKGYIAPQGTLTWNSQTTFVLPIVGSKATTYMFMGDRWSYPCQYSAATYVWQPLIVTNSTIFLPDFKESWNVDVTDGVWFASSIPGNEMIENTDTNRITYSASWTTTSPTNGFQDTRSDVSNAMFSVDFDGSRIGIYGVGRSDGGYGRVEIQNDNGQTILSRIFETYCKYPESSLKFLSPVLPRGHYKLIVTVLGQHFAWTLKNGTITGSQGNHVSVDKIVIQQ